MTKAKLFEILDGLEVRTRPLMDKALARLAAAKGAGALQPWNMPQALSGDTSRALDPYFPFENAVDVWARSFAAFGITYSGAEAKLDLLDRAGKYSNGFCHWPQPAYRKADGAWVPSQTDFTSLAVPSSVGSGYGALTTLMHEVRRAELLRFFFGFAFLLWFCAADLGAARFCLLCGGVG